MTSTSRAATLLFLSVVVLFGLDYPDVHATRKACEAMPPFKVWHQLTVDALAQKDLAIEELIDNSHPSYRKRTLRERQISTGVVIGESYFLTPKGVGPFKQLLSGELSVLHPLSMSDTCPFSQSMSNKYLKEAFGAN